MSFLSESLQDNGKPERRASRPVLARSGGELAQYTYFGLYALQHRGQESAGIAVSDGERTTAVRDMGLVSQVFDEARLAALEAGHIALGHVRYSTTGSASGERPARSSTAAGVRTSPSPTTATW